MYIDSLTYIVNGLGGRSIYSFINIMPGSIVRYNNNYGAMTVNDYTDSLTFKFYSISGNLKDDFKITPSEKVLNLTAVIQGFYDTLSNKMTGDTAKVLLRNSYSPYTAVDSAMSFIDSSGSGVFVFTKALNFTNYFVTVKHRNSLETWSSAPLVFVLDQSNCSFTASDTSAFGKNLTLKGTKYCLYSGDQDQNGKIELLDLLNILNDAADFVTGYVQSDITGDLNVDLSDELIAHNNSIKFVSKIIP
ncbi:MAG: hypothetical protein IPL53_23290 [Ignavibacteria bacterium]|nr:hypothetical protein [Ignavibacteria bacterium]